MRGWLPAVELIANYFSVLVLLPAQARNGGTFESVTATFTLTDHTCQLAQGDVSTSNTVTMDDQLKGTVTLDFPSAKFIVQFQALICTDTPNAGLPTSCTAFPSAPVAAPPFVRTGLNATIRRCVYATLSSPLAARRGARTAASWPT